VWDAPRDYKIPEGVLHSGTNTIAVKVLDWGGHSGFWKNAPAGMSVSVSLTQDEIATEECIVESRCTRAIPLAGEWKFKAFPAEPRPVDPSSPSSWDIAACHNGMVAPLFGMAAKGAIWYQGCSDVGNADLYAKQFPAMVGAWREGFVHDDAGFPVYLVQLAAFKETHAEPLDSAWARMRWTQMRLGETVPHCGTAVAIDVGDHRDIHPKDKKTVGERLARLALARTYQGHKDDGSGPIPLSAAVRADASYPEPAPVIVRFVRPDFSDALRLATSDGQAVRGFQFVYEDGSAEAAAAEIDRYAVLLFPKDKTPVRVRYAWDDYPDGNLVNGEGLPCGPFELEIER
jgi:sialate O-acetylesterase